MTTTERNIQLAANCGLGIRIKPAPEDRDDGRPRCALCGKPLDRERKGAHVCHEKT